MEKEINKQQGSRTGIVSNLLNKYGFTTTLHNLVMVSKLDPVARDLLIVLPIITAEQEFLNRIQYVFHESVLSEICYQTCDRYLR